MNCSFCQSNIDHSKSTGRTYQCINCKEEHGLVQVVLSFDIEGLLMDTHIRVDRVYYFHVDYRNNKTYMVGPQEYTKYGNLLTIDNTVVTPKSAKNKLQTYLLFL